ncbi:MAG: helix-turn-helix domain-containing protein [Actinomycetota bacterium]|nr:helix-turn-helix domain-containing protein [Actinomycetota bacterium]
MPSTRQTAPTNWGTVREAATLFKVSDKTIRRMISRGDIRAERIGPRLIRVDLNSLESIGRPLQWSGGDAA